MRRASCKFSTSSSKKLASLGEQTSLPGTSTWLTRSQLIVKRGKPRPAHDRRPLLASGSGQRYTLPITGMHAFRSLGQNEIGCSARENSMKRFTTRGATIAYITIGRSPDGTSLHLIWAHGWGQDHRALVPMARALEPLGTQILLDFPGFGSSPPPPVDWGTADYADALADSLGILPRRLRILIGYSFGCRIGLQLAARYPDTIDGLFLIAAAGLHQSKTPLQGRKNRLI
jgi:alpha/beta hydrolase fold